MAQATLDNDELFGEAAGELREQVDEALDAARASLPEATAIWETDAENVLGVLNGVRTAIDTETATEQLRNAKKWYTMGQRAGAFEADGELAAEIASLEETIEKLSEVEELVTSLTTTLPGLRDNLSND